MLTALSLSAPQSTPGAFAPNPQLSLPDEQDKLSDYIPGSNEISRVPSRQPSDGSKDDESVQDDESALGDEVEEDEDGDVEMNGNGASSSKQAKKPSVLKKEAAARERTKQKKEAKKTVDDHVSGHSATSVLARRSLLTCRRFLRAARNSPQASSFAKVG